MAALSLQWLLASLLFGRHTVLLLSRGATQIPNTEVPALAASGNNHQGLGKIHVLGLVSQSLDKVDLRLMINQVWKSLLWRTNL